MALAIVQEHDQEESLEIVNSLHHNSLHAMIEKQEGSRSRDIEWREEHGEMGSEVSSKRLQCSEQSPGQQEEFEPLCNNMDSFSENFPLSCFISGLTPQVQQQVTSLTKEITFAKIQEQELAFNHMPLLLPTPLSTPTSTTSNHAKPFHTTSSPTPNSNRVPSHNTKSQTKPPIQQLSQSQIHARHDKGLCFYCDGNYTFDHKCQPSIHLFIVPNSFKILENNCVLKDRDDVQQDKEEVVDMSEPPP